LYVIEINPEKNEIFVGPKKFLIKREIKLKNLNLLANNDEFNKNIFVKVRSTGKLIQANIKIEKNNAQVHLLEDEYGISPGQACVFYSKNKDGFKVLGGGWIYK
jgi:tRNA-specific 2-thiouridylase